MGNIYKRGKYWYLDLRVKGRRIRKRVGSSKEIATLALRDAEVKAARDEFGFAKNDIAIEKFFDLYLEYSRANHQPNPLTTTVNVVKNGMSVAVASHGKGDGSFNWNNSWTKQTEQLDPGTLIGTSDHAETVDGTFTARITKTGGTTNRYVLAAVSLAPVSGGGTGPSPAASVSEDQEEDELIPDEFRLYANYPNPFNPTTTIAFDLPIATHVRISVYNILGQEVTIVLDEQRSAGNHLVYWEGVNNSARSVASGMYFYRTIAGDFIESKKMILLK